MVKRTRHIREELASNINTDNPEITLGQLTEDDYRSYASVVGDNYEHALAGGLDIGKYSDPHAVAEFQQGDDIVVYGIRRNDEIVGGVHISNETSPEISYWIDRNHVRQKLGSAAVYTTTLHMKEAIGGQVRIRAQVNRDNPGSIHILRSVGYVPDQKNSDHAAAAFVHPGYAKVKNPNTEK